jgi:colanic acid biosynthesis glycosyl transferase WcaI
MRLLVVTQYFWPEDFRVNDFVVGMVERGHDVTVLTGFPNYPDGEIFPAFREAPRAFDRFNGVKVVRVPIIGRGRGAFRLVLNYLSFATTGLLVGAWMLRKRQFDAIFAVQSSPVTAVLPALLFRATKRAPVLMWILDLWPETLSAVGAVRSRWVLGAIGRLVRFIYRRCDRVLVQSRAFWPCVVRDGVAAGRIRYLPNWIEPVFQRGVNSVAVAPELASFSDTFNVMFAGNVGEAQDLLAVLDAAEAVRDLDRVRWLIVGDGRAMNLLRAEIIRRGLEDRVRLLGRHSTDRMPAFFAGADALLVSLRPEPIFAMTVPGKVQSYLVAGRPVLGMIDGEGARVIEASGGGLAVAAGDGPGLGTAVRKLVSMSSDQLRAMGEAGRSYALVEFDRDRLFDQFIVWAQEARADFEEPS